ncbi:uncharacterized protein N0V89_009927 [Didymosphaeria variabile]|uniref:EthD domain-containing protein n=1 Tax=Didymosphaeria variabile TaxID=1932322 RepID=A0A9W8XEN9_9PLEO|nr:uncharacterized protein N0V89_009927 [Didymosphaeria variabile]KAJ4348550.1 hypothetical protein N0V89_009927 [Didymosphaeria variabile]
MHIPIIFPLLSLLPLTTAFPSSPYNTSTCTRTTPDYTNCSPLQGSNSSSAKQCPHHYTFPEFAPGTGSNRQPYFRFLILFKLNPDLCEEQAHEHWQTVHADLTLAAKNTGVLIERYVQFHADQEHKDAIQSLVDTASVEVAPYDGIAEFHAKDAASVLKFIDNAFGDDQIVRDQGYFVNEGDEVAGYGW